MTTEQILELYKRHDYMTLEEEGFLNAGWIAHALMLGAISRDEAEELSQWIY